MLRRRKLRFSTSIGCAILIGSLIGQVKPTIGRPGNIINTVATPSVGAPAQETRDIDVGDLSLASDVGSLEYRYDFVVPPGRLDLQPSISLAYSSQGSLRGGIASNWSMALPRIERDLSDETVGMAVGSIDHDELPFVASMSGGHRLVPVTEPVEAGWQSFRAERDDDFIRYERSIAAGIWRARTLDGKTWYFGIGHEGENQTLDYGTGPLMRHTYDAPVPPPEYREKHNVADRQPLTRVVDQFGNTIRYFWDVDVNSETGYAEEMRIASIRYTENYGAGLGSHARMDFVYDEDLTYCSATPSNRSLPAGASVSYKDGHPWYSGRHTLLRVETYARSAVPERVVELGIASRCPNGGGSKRDLESITLKTPGNLAVELSRPISFQYGDAAPAFASTRGIDIFNKLDAPFSPGSLSWGYIHGYDSAFGEATVEQTLLDFDGDGRLDVLRSSPSGACSFQFYRNNGSGISDMQVIPFPSEGLSWQDGIARAAGEGCTLSARRTLWGNKSAECGLGTGIGTPRHYGNYLNHRFIDMNRDGKPDLVTSMRLSGTHLSARLPDAEPDDPGYMPGISSVLNEPLPGDLPAGGPCKIVADNAARLSLVPECLSGDGCSECTYSDPFVLQGFAAMEDGARCGQFGTFTTDHFGGCGKLPSLPLEVDGYFPWTVYYNTGGDLETTGHRVWSPMPLDPQGAESSLGNSNGAGLSSSKHAILDITGDGVIDVLLVSDDTGFEHWQVFRGRLNPVTGFHDGFSVEPEWWTVPNGAVPSGSAKQEIPDPNDPDTGVVQTSTTDRLVDMNGDGLPDIIREGSNGLEVALNMGAGFCAWDGELGGEAQINSHYRSSATGYDDLVFGCRELAVVPDGGSGDDLCLHRGAVEGVGQSLLRTVDIDGDGLVDFYDGWDEAAGIEVPDSTPTVHMNGAGGGFEEDSSPWPHILPRDVQVDLSAGWWAVYSDFMDLDGDGLDDVITPSGSTLNLTSDDSSDGKPLRLLNRIDNGQGLITDIEYQPYNSESVAIDPSNQTGMPQHVWVVSKVSERSQLQIDARSPPSVVELRYGDPVYNQDGRGQFGFRGFTRIETSSPHGLGETSGFSVTAKEWDYDLDWSGRVVETVVYADGFPVGGGADATASITQLTLVEHAVVNGQSLSYAVESERNRNCETPVGGFKTETQCLGDPISREFHFVFEGYRDYAGGSALPVQMFKEIQKWHSPRGSFDGFTDDDLILDEDLGRLYADEGRYILLSTEQLRHQGDGAGLGLQSKSYSTPHASGTYISHERKHVDASIDSALWTHRERDLSTGLLLWETTPNHYQTGIRKDFSYSGYKISPSGTTNELGHVSTVVRDLGTGAVLEEYGPNLLDCAPSEHGGLRHEYDFLGRKIASYVIGCEGGSFGETLSSTVVYTDFDPETAEPAHVTATTILDSTDPSATTQSTIHFDGQGRTVRTTLDRGPGLAPAIVNFHYKASGELERVDSPNPSTDPADTRARVETVYAFDSLGRGIGMRQSSATEFPPNPDDQQWDNFVGVDIDYGFDGIYEIKTSTEHVLSGRAAQTVTFTDFFGRLVQVDERTGSASTTSSFASTFYEFDGNDNMSRVVDADGIETIMEHDWASRRTKVQRGAREWSYAYDGNGNIVLQTSPNDQGQSVDSVGSGEFTTSTVFDALNRPTSKLLATRDLNDADLDAFDSRELGFTYDTCTNGIGRVCQETAGLNHTVGYFYDWAGRVVERNTFITFPGDGGDFSRSQFTKYNISGAVTEEWLADAADKSSSTHVSYAFDGTGAPNSVALHEAAGSDMVTTVVRNEALLITQQVSGCLTRNWAYDYLGRVTSTDVVRGSGAGSAPSASDCSVQNGTALSEQVSYFDSSDVATHAVFRGLLPQRDFSYEFDDQHQLIGASNTIGGALGDYDVGFQYTGAGRLADIGSHVGAEIQGRSSMDYGVDLGGYGDGTLTGGDEHAPVDIVGDEFKVRYQYDFAGNVIKRTEEPEKGKEQEWDFKYDGMDQQRELTIEDKNGDRERYYYDAAGSRYMMVTYNSLSSSKPSRVRVWIGGAEIWLSDGPGNQGFVPDTEYGHISLGDLNVGRVKTEGTLVTAEASFHNGLGHLMGAVDWSTGIVNAAFVYGPYGEILDSIGDEQDTHLRRFNGKEADQLSKLNYYGFRYHDPLSLTWTQSDPLFRVLPDLAYDQPREMSLYTFSLNNPIRYLDPDGRKNEMASFTKGGARVDTANAVAASKRSNADNAKIAAIAVLPLVVLAAPVLIASALAIETGADVLQAGAALQNAVSNPSTENTAAAFLAIGDVFAGPSPAAETVTIRRLTKPGDPKVQKAASMIKASGAGGHANPKNSKNKQEGNITIDFGGGSTVNVRVETHPIPGSKGKPVRHANVETVKRKGSKKKVKTKHIVDDKDKI